MILRTARSCAKTPRFQCWPQARNLPRLQRMATSQSPQNNTRASLSHEERTASTPREKSAHIVKLTSITPANDNIRLLRLDPVDQTQAFHFRAGQWLDVFVPGIPKAGGFTITSAPARAKNPPVAASADQDFALELAVQNSPNNPPAAWLWRPVSEIVGTDLTVRVGGSFFWPPDPSVIPELPRNVVLIAGGVGINPLISMVRDMDRNGDKNSLPAAVTLLYSTKAATNQDGSDILFVEQIKSLSQSLPKEKGLNFHAQMFITSTAAETRDKSHKIDADKVGLPIQYRRITTQDLESALPESHRNTTVCYICGPREFSDTLVDAAKSLPGMNEERVMCEKWW